MSGSQAAPENPERIRLPRRLRAPEVVGVVAEIRRRGEAGPLVLDFGEVEEFDSSTLALVGYLRRHHAGVSAVNIGCALARAEESFGRKAPPGPAEAPADAGEPGRFFRAYADRFLARARSLGRFLAMFGDEVYHVLSDKYFQSLQDDNLDHAPMDANGVENSGWWAECQGEYSGDDYVAGTSYALGDIVREPETGTYYQYVAQLVTATEGGSMGGPAVFSGTVDSGLFTDIADSRYTLVKVAGDWNMYYQGVTLLYHLTATDPVGTMTRDLGDLPPPDLALVEGAGTQLSDSDTGYWSPLTEFVRSIDPTETGRTEIGEDTERVSLFVNFNQVRFSL